MLWDDRFRMLTADVFEQAVDMAGRGWSVGMMAVMLHVQQSTLLWWLRIGSQRTRGRYSRFWTAMVRARAAHDEHFRRIFDVR